MDRVPPFDYAEVEKIFREELGKAPEELFDSFDRTPIASASIGQVHVARHGGRKLAVKVQRPRARRDFGGDILLMKWASAAIRRLRLERLDWLAVALDEFVSWTGEELDFRAEARIMDQLAANSRDRRRERVPRGRLVADDDPHPDRRVPRGHDPAAVPAQPGGGPRRRRAERLAAAGFEPRALRRERARELPARRLSTTACFTPICTRPIC